MLRKLAVALAYPLAVNLLLTGTVVAIHYLYMGRGFDDRLIRLYYEQPETTRQGEELPKTLMKITAKAMWTIPGRLVLAAASLLVILASWPVVFVLLPHCGLGTRLAIGALLALPVPGFWPDRIICTALGVGLWEIKQRERMSRP